MLLALNRLAVEGVSTFALHTKRKLPHVIVRSARKRQGRWDDGMMGSAFKCAFVEVSLAISVGCAASQLYLVACGAATPPCLI